MEKISGGTMVVRTLKAFGVDTIFGIPSVHNMPIYDAIAREGGIDAITVRHEQGAAGMADGYARATGKTGVCITSTGPGAANAAGGMLEALTASSPVLQVTGQIETPYLDKGKGFLHEAPDQLSMLRAVSGYAERAASTDDIPQALSRAFRATRQGRPQPAAIEIPIDLQYAESAFSLPQADEPPRPEPDPAAIAAAARLIAGAGRPVVWAGGGVISSGASEQVVRLTERLGAPVITTTTGRGSIPEDHPLALGPLFNDRFVRELLATSDSLIAVGTRFQGAHTANWTAKLPENLIHIDVDADVVGRNYPPAVPIVADAKLALAALLSQLGPGARGDADYAAEIFRVRTEARERARQAVEVHLPIMDALRTVLDRDAIVVKDATLPAYTWGNRLLEVYEPRTSIHSTTVAIGPGLALALGARVARPDRQTVLIAGDGGFMLNIAELATAAQYNIGVVILLFNDRGYGVLRNHQDQRFDGRRIGVDLHTPDFLQLAAGFGLQSERVETKEAFRPALERALAADAPVLLDIDELQVGVPLFPSPSQPSMSLTPRAG